jgi:3-hydroxyacyl-[acyl-carrier-protein] dehydratase
MRLEYFEMIDRVVAFDRDAKRIEAQATVPMESPVFEGHFPGHPLVPGVLLTETMAQASGYLLLGLCDFTHMPFLMAVDKARFRSFVGPGTVLHIAASVEHEGSGYAGTTAKIVAGGKPLCDAALRFKTMPFPEGLGDRMRGQGRKIGLIGSAS